MIRAGIFIGVDKTGTLPRLNDAAAGAKRMHQWALSQGMADQTHAKLITDADGKKVGPDMIYDAIKEIIDGSGVDQLILYFAGHGVNSNGAEQWLLTDAPARASAAVNVSGSVELARYCGIQYVVVISDACRVAPEGIQGQRVSGVEVFPNEGGGGKAKPVDQFFACYLGKTAAELRDPVITSKYSALYTEALLDALRGERAEVLEPAPPGEDNVYYIRPVRLENYLENEVPLRVRAAIQALNLKYQLNQNPDAIIIASPSTWVARIEKRAISAGPPRAAPPAASAHVTVRNAARKLVRSAVLGDRAKLHLELEKAKVEPIAEVRQLAQTAERIVIPFGPDHFETECGIKVRGRRIIEFFAPRA
jgi:Caspase domain